MYTRRRHAAMEGFTASELLSTPLEELCLNAKNLGVAPGGGGAADSIAGFLGRAVDPPRPISVDNAVSLLQQIGALTPKEQLTPLGAKIAGLPVDPRLGKMFAWASLFANLPAALLCGAAIGYVEEGGALPWRSCPGAAAVLLLLLQLRCYYCYYYDTTSTN